MTTSTNATVASEGSLPSTTGAPPTAAQADPCPAPLSWQQVLETFRHEAERWEMRRGSSRLVGRTWGNGPPLYLLPGLGGTHELFALLIYLLRDEFRCVTFDVRDNDRNNDAKPSPAPTADDFARDLFAVADRHDDRRFRVYAAGFGCVAALRTMLAEPDRIQAAVLQGGCAHRKLSLTERLLIRLGGRSRRTLAELPFREAVETQNHKPWFPPFDHSRWRFFVDDTGRVSVCGLARRAAVLRRFDVRDRLGEITQPVLLVRTEGDGRITAGCQDLLEARLPNARVEFLTSCGQLPFLTHPHRLAKLMRVFLAADGAMKDER